MLLTAENICKNYGMKQLVDDVTLYLNDGERIGLIGVNGTTPPDETITEAAQLAAYYSEAREGQNVSVDITSVRNLKKPNGAKPGMVVYERYRTVIVTPDPAQIDRSLQKNS